MHARSCQILPHLSASSKDLQTSTTTGAIVLQQEAQPWMPARLIELGSATDHPSNPQGPGGLPLALASWVVCHGGNDPVFTRLFMVLACLADPLDMIAQGCQHMTRHCLRSWPGRNELDKPHLGR